jgi:hypothetical protein
VRQGKKPSAGGRLRTRGLQFKTSLGKKVHEIPFQQKKTGCGHAPIIPAMIGSIKWGITVQAILGKKCDPISRITRVKWTEGVAQAVECLLCTCEALNSNPSSTKKKKSSVLSPWHPES